MRRQMEEKMKSETAHAFWREQQLKACKPNTMEHDFIKEQPITFWTDHRQRITVSQPGLTWFFKHCLLFRGELKFQPERLIHLSGRTPHFRNLYLNVTTNGLVTSFLNRIRTVWIPSENTALLIKKMFVKTHQLYFDNIWQLELVAIDWLSFIFMNIGYEKRDVIVQLWHFERCRRPNYSKTGICDN